MALMTEYWLFAGATLAAQTIIRHNLEHPEAPIQDMPFRFAIFFNGATPSKVFEMSETPIPVSMDLWQTNRRRFISSADESQPTSPYHQALSSETANGRPILTDSSRAC